MPTDTEVTEPVVDDEHEHDDTPEQPEPAKEAESVEIVRHEDVAVDRLGEAALQLPTVAGRDEFLALAMQARTISMSALAPKPLRGKPFDALLVLLTGRDLGIPTTVAMRKCYVVDGQVTLAPQLKIAQVHRHGIGRIAPHGDNSDAWAAAVAYDAHGNVLGMSEFTWTDAQRAGLVDWRCTASDHWSSGNTKCGCKHNWRTYPQRMLWWRAAGYAVDDYFPEVGMGIYTPDELGALTDEEGEPIDPSTVELPAGFEPSQRTDTPVERADVDELWDLQRRIHALPDEQRAELRNRWKNHGELKLWRPFDMPRGLHNLARSMVTGFERNAAKAGHDVEAALAAVDEHVAAALVDVLLGSRHIAQDDASRAPRPDDDASTRDDAPTQQEGTQPPEREPQPWDGLDLDAVNVDTAPADLVDGVIEEVKSMPPSDVKTALRQRDLPVPRETTAARQQLGIRLVREYMARRAQDDA